MKFILMPIPSDKDCEDLLKEAIGQGSERGLFMSASFGQDIYKHLNLLMERGYHSTGIIIDSESKNVEFIFNRHRSQRDNMRLEEVKIDNPLAL